MACGAHSGLKPQDHTTVALRAEQEVPDPSSSPQTTSTVTSDERRVWLLPAPTPHWSGLASVLDADCRYGCGSCDAPARQGEARVRSPDARSSDRGSPQSERRRAFPARRTTRGYLEQGRGDPAWDTAPRSALHGTPRRVEGHVLAGEAAWA